MDLQTIFGLLRKLFADQQIFLGFAIVFRSVKLFDSDLREILRFKIFFGICKIFLDCPFSASVAWPSCSA